MSEQTIEQKLTAEVVNLKSRILDTQDQAAAFAQESKVLQNTLAQIAQVVGIQGESVQLEDIVKAVQALVPVQEEIAE